MNTMWDFILSNAWQFWAVASVICLILELFSGDLFLMSIAISAAITAVFTLFGPSFAMQLLIFIIFSLLTLFLVRPPLLKLLHKGEDKRDSNADALVGKTGIVTQDSDTDGYGRVSLGGDDWKACTADGSALLKGDKVKFMSRESIILTVEKI